MGGECAKEGAGVAQRVTAERENLAKSPDHDGGIITVVRTRAWTHWPALEINVLTYSFVTNSQSCALPRPSHALKGNSLRHCNVGLALHSLGQVGHS